MTSLYFIYTIFINMILGKIKERKILLFLFLFPFFLILSCQVNIGQDYYSYIRIFNGIKDLPLSRGPLFVYLIWVLRKISTNFRIMFVSVAFLQIYLYYKIIDKMLKKNYVNDVGLFLFLSLTVTNFYFMLFNVLRSSIATLLLFYGTLYLLEGKTIKYYICIFIGIGFHPSMTLFIILPFLRKLFFFRYSYFKIVIFMCACFALNKINFVPGVAKYIYHLNFNFLYKEYLISNHMFPYHRSFGVFIFCLLILFIFSLKQYKKINEKKIFLYNFGYFFFALRLLFAGIPIFTRIIDYSYLFQTLIMYYFLSYQKRKNYMYFLTIILFFSLGFIREITM